MKCEQRAKPGSPLFQTLTHPFPLYMSRVLWILELNDYTTPFTSDFKAVYHFSFLQTKEPGVSKLKITGTVLQEAMA